jgi:hypothetical protein
MTARRPIMDRASKLTVAFALLASLILACRDAGASAVLTAGASSDNTTITFSWSYYEDLQNPVGHPEWIGYDVYRRALPGCGTWTRVNANPYPRTPGISENFSYSEAPPSLQTPFEYHVVLVDAARTELFFSPAECDCGAASHGWASCPPFSAPLSQGTLTDWGWTVAIVTPCAGSCYSGFYVSDPATADQLRPYAGNGEVVKFFGSAACGSVEGCAVALDRYELSTCGVVATRTASWGRLKTIYR